MRHLIVSLFNGAIAFCIGGLIMSICYGGTLTKPAEPAPFWTLLLVLGFSLLIVILSMVSLRKTPKLPY
jgi:hypothetical protein